ncbi:hypothetical protein [Planctomycetes bacterium Pla163]
MMKPLELGLLGVGGLSLFSVCFVGFASVAGVPMHTLPVIGGLYEAPPVHEEEPEPLVQDPDDPEQIATNEQKLSNPQRKIIENSVASLGSWTLPPPFEMEDLGRLVDELRTGRDDLDRQTQLLDSREEQIAEELDSLSKRSTQLDELRRDLEEREAQLARKTEEFERLAEDLNRTDLLRDDDAEKELLRQSLFFAEGEIDEAAKRLASFDAEEAALILHKLTDSNRAVAILNALPETAWKEYMTAYSRAAN